jgi:hypothetical protein
VRAVTAIDALEEEDIRVEVKKFNQTMTQINRFISPELQATLDNNDLMVVGQFLIISNLRDCPQESLEAFGETFELLSDRKASQGENCTHLLSVENCDRQI